jgi:tetratricopeptide (TPR) repeat protein
MGLPGTAATFLADAVACLNDGAPADAERLLAEALRLEPQSAVAMYLMGVAHHARRDFSGAEGWLRQARTLTPGQPKIHLQLAQTLRALQRPAEAVEVCRRLIILAPTQPEAWLQLAGAQEEAGDADGAEASLRQMLVAIPQATDGVAALAGLLTRQGRAVEAETLLKTALADAHARPVEAIAALEHQLGLALKRQQRPREAITHFDRARRHTAHPAAVETDRAILLQQLERFDESIAAYGTVLQADPLNMAAHLQVSTLLRHLGREDFLASYDAASARAPDALILPVTKGRALLKLGRAQDAREVFEQALRRAPDAPAVLAGLGSALEALGEQAAAIALHERNVTRNPDSPEILLACAAARLRGADAQRAKILAARAHAAAPADQTALALLGLAQRALGDPQESVLNDYQRLVRVFDLDPPDGFASMEDFNRELAAYLESLHTGALEYLNQTLRGGSQTREGIFFLGHDLAERLRARIDAAIRRYVLELPGNAAAPFINRRTGGVAYAGSWSSRLMDCGFHVNHIHALGWISSVYYVGVPDAVADVTAQQGWLKFGEPSADFGDAFPLRRAIQPRPGRLVLFPSYMWHGTVPFHSAQSRTTIAFDVIPAPV